MITWTVEMVLAEISFETRSPFVALKLNTTAAWLEYSSKAG
jgi:hypothetical protein